jgi:integrase
MGRKPTINSHLPPRMRARKRGNRVHYYYDHGGKPRRETALGSDYVQAVQKWAQINMSPAPVHYTVGYAISQYIASADYDQLAPGTRVDYGYAIEKLIAEFGLARLDEVRPAHIQKYVDWRGKESLHRAQREMKILGMIYRFAVAREWTATNPVAAIRFKRLPGRKNVYIEDRVVLAVYEKASAGLRDAIDLAYFVGQRPVDVLNITEDKIKDGVLTVRQTKTGAPVRIRVTSELAALIERIRARKRAFAVQPLALIVDERGQPMTKYMLRGRFEKARAAAGEIAAGFQFRDLRSKSASDLRDEADIEAAQTLLGHASVTMTEHYTRNRLGKLADVIPQAKWKGNK